VRAPSSNPKNFVGSFATKWAFVYVIVVIVEKRERERRVRKKLSTMHEI